MPLAVPIVRLRSWSTNAFQTFTCVATTNNFRMAGKPTTIKEALGKFEEKEGCKANEAKKVLIYGQIPPLEKMDASLSTLVACEQLALSTNTIEKIANLNGLKNLKILSLARNNIKSLTGLEPVGDTLEQLWISNNFIEKLKGINVLKKLKMDLHCLKELGFVGNPLEEQLKDQDIYNDTISRKLTALKNLDGFPVIRPGDEDEDEQQQQES